MSSHSISLEELASLPTFYLPTLNDTKTKIAFYWDKDGQMDLFIKDTEPQAEPVRITNGELPKSLHAGFVWSKDGQYIYFPKDNDGDEQHNIWRVNIETCEVEQLTANPKGQEIPVDTHPDGKTVLVASNKDGQLNLYALDTTSGEYTQLTYFHTPIWHAQYSPDGSQIALISNETDNVQNMDVYGIPSTGGEPKLLLRSKIGNHDGFSNWSHDGAWLAVDSDVEGYTQIGAMNVMSGETRWLTPEGVDYTGGVFSPDNQQLLCYQNKDAAIGVTIYDLKSGQPLDIELPPGLSYNADWLDNKRFIVNIATDTRRAELRDYHLDNGQSDVWLVAEYGSIDPALFVKHEYIWYESTDGTSIPAILYRPRNMQAGQQYPAIVNVHGGPTAQWFRGFDVYAQFLADHGYLVLNPNPRGSTGYGVEFRDACLKDWGGKDLEDMEGAHRYLASLPEVDTTRIGIFGGSYGGYMTFMVMTKQPDLWKAGVAWVGMTDLPKLYESSMDHYKYYLQWQMGDPVEDADLWWDRSAVNFVHQMTGKLLIVHGVNDPRCPIEQARIFRDRLLELGKIEGEDFEYVELGEEGHGSTDIDQKIRAYKLLADFMERRL